MPVKVELRFGNSHTMEDFKPADYETEVERILNRIFPTYDLLFTGQLTSIAKGDARMGQRKIKVTSYPREREKTLCLHVQPGDNGTCMKVILQVPNNFSATEVYEKIRTLTTVPKKVKTNRDTVSENVSEVSSADLTVSEAKDFLKQQFTSELDETNKEIALHESKIAELRQNATRLESNLAYLDEIQ